MGRVRPAAVLWDMDGTLVDTERAWIAAEYEVVARHGGTWSDEHAQALVGSDLLDAGRYLRHHAGIEPSPEQIVDELLDSVVERIRQDIPWRPGARELLSALNEAGIPCALVTMAWRRFVDPIVEALPPGSFQAVVTGDEVSRGKPHPEPYVTAARLLGVSPGRCLAIEDSPTGAASASAAGCVVVGVPNVVAVPAAPGRHLFTSLTELDLDGIERLFNPHRRRVTMAVVAVAALMVAGIAAWSTTRDATTRAPGPLTLDVWAPGWLWSRAVQQANVEWDLVDEFSPFWLQVVADDQLKLMPGTPPGLVATGADDVIARARRAGVRIVPSIVDALPAGGMSAVLQDPLRRSRHISTLVAAAREGGWDGVDLDYEQFAFADDRDTWEATSPAWMSFVTELAAALRAEGRTLTATVPPVYGRGRSEAAGYWVYDHAALAEVVDRIRIMAYDYSTARPGPIAPLAWVQRVIDGAVAVTGRPDLVVLGVPVYGYNWPAGSDGTCPATAEGRVGVNASTVNDLIVLRGANPVYDERTGEWAAVYDIEVSDGDTTCVQARRMHWVDGAGAVARAQLAQQAGLAGVALWAWGYDDAQFWRDVRPLMELP